MFDDEISWLWAASWTTASPFAPQKSVETGDPIWKAEMEKESYISLFNLSRATLLCQKSVWVQVQHKILQAIHQRANTDQ